MSLNSVCAINCLQLVGGWARLFRVVSVEKRSQGAHFKTHFYEKRTYPSLNLNESIMLNPLAFRLYTHELTVDEDTAQSLSPQS